VEPGAPEIVIADRFDLAKPDQIIASPDGTRRLEIYGPRYRLIDVATGAQLADDVGKEVRFSPTGRFVIAVVENSFAIRDNLDGKVVHKQRADEPRSEYTLAWDDRDSFLIPIGTAGLNVYPSYIWHGFEDTEGGDIDCPCSDNNFVWNPSFKLDLENNVVIAGYQTLSLTIHPSAKDGEKFEFVDIASAAPVLPVAAPTSWDTIDGLKLTHLWPDLYSFTDDQQHNSQIAAALERFVVRPVIDAKGDAQGLRVNKDPMQIASRGLGAVKLPESELDLRKDQTLRDFGVEVNPGASMLKQDQAVGLKKIEGFKKTF
jgi:hypothetical protein